MKKTLLLTVIILLLAVSPCYATVNAQFLLDASDLQAESSETSMTLVSSSVMDGRDGVSTLPTIALEFNKNVVNLAVLKHNSQCIHLLDQQGNPLEIKLIFPDDQMQQEYKRQIFIMPTAELSPKAQYTIIVDNNLLSKNEIKLDNAYYISFTTGEEATVKTNRILAELLDNVLEMTVQTGKTEFSEKIYTPLVFEKPVSAPWLNLKIMTVVLVLFSGILLLSTAYLNYKKRLYR